jgi:sugar/nucleoside kinase (ribokinase family)
MRETDNQDSKYDLFLGSARGLLDEGVGAVVVSRGAIGAELLAPDRRLQVGAPRGEVTDEFGTAETLCGVLVALLFEGLTIEAALPRAVEAAAIAATRPGCWGGLPSAAELAALGG